MARELSWIVVEEQLRIALVLTADATRYLIGMGVRGDQAAAAILGMKDVPNTHLDDLIGDPVFLNSIVTKGTELEAAARRCFDIVTVRHPLETIDVQHEREEVTEWLSYFLAALPREAMGGWDYTAVSHPDAPLVKLLRKAEARINLAEFVQEAIGFGSLRHGFVAADIAALADAEVRTVRNVMGPKGDKPILTRPTVEGRSSKDDYVWGDPLDTLEWLSGRRGFNPGRLSVEWVNERLLRIPTFEAAAAMPGIVSWVNCVTSQDLAARLRWPPDQLRK